MPRHAIRLHSVNLTPLHTPPLVHTIQSDTSPGVFFAKLADALAAPTFTYGLALYVGHGGALVHLTGLGAILLRWPSFGSEVLEVRYIVCAWVVIISFLPP
jgi:hypothetical protein